MIIQCDSCNTKFRLDDSKVSPTGIKVRCTQCRNVFIVWPPERAEEAAPAAPEEAGEPKAHDAARDTFGEERNEWGSALESDDEPAGDKGAADNDDLLNAMNEALVKDNVEGAGDAGEGDEGLDFSFDEEETDTRADIGPEDLGFGASADRVSGLEDEGPGQSPADEFGAARPLDTAFSERTDDKTDFFSSATAGSEEATAEDEVAFSGGESSEASASASLEDILAGRPSEGGVAFEETEEEDEPAFAPAAKKPRKMGLGLLIVLIIIIAGGGAVYFSGIINSLIGSMMSSPAPAARTVAIQNIDGYVVENVSFGRVFVIEAKIRNIMSEPQEVTGVRGSLYDSSGKKLTEKTVSPGRIASQDEIRNLSGAVLMKRFMDASGGTLPPRGTVPVMVLFEKIPEGTAEFGIEVLH